MIGKGHSGALVTVVERVTKFTAPRTQVNSKSAADRTKTTLALLKDVSQAITTDNGKEFAHHEKSASHYPPRYTLPTLTALGSGA